MVVSLYICEIPKNVTKEDIENLFSEIEGYRETRTKGTNDKRKIAFVDYENEKDAKFAMEALQGFKFSEEDKGLIIKFSDNMKGGQSQPFKQRDRRESDRDRDRGRDRERERYPRKRQRSDSESDRSDLIKTGKRSTDDDNLKNYKKEDNIIKSLNTVSKDPNQSTSVLPNSSSTNFNILDALNQISDNMKNSSTLNQSNIQDNNSSSINPNVTANSNPDVNTQNLQGIFDVLSNLQTVQILTQLAGNPILPQTSQESSTPHQRQPSPHKKMDSFSNAIFSFDDEFADLIHFKKNATNIVYVEGLPFDATDREVAHIFRPFPGFKSVRLITRDKNGEKSLICFADFEDIIQSTICINTLQGYRFDKNDLVGLHFSYGVNKNKKG